MASTVTSPRRLPSDPPEPDISHLTEDEQQIILSVLKRSKAEEQKDEKIINNLEQDVKRIEANIKRMQKTVTDSVSLLGNASDPDTCRICNVVKFAGGAGYRCHYCQLKSCSRCGGKLTFKTKIIWACNLCRKKQELALKTGTWYNGPKGSGFQRRHSLLRQTSFTSDNETSGHRRSRDMLPGNAAKRSSSAHALMETDRLDENMNQYRFRTRILSGDTSDKRGNGDVGQAVRLRGEMESTTLVTPNRIISSAGNKQYKNVSKSGSSGSQFLTMQRDDLAPLAAASPTNKTPSQSSSLSSSSRTLTTGGDSLDNRAWKAASSPPLDSNRGPVTGVRVSPYLDKMQTGSDSTLRDQTSSLSSRRSDSSLRSHERAQAQDSQAFVSEESSHTQKEHSFSSGPKIQTTNQNSRQEELIFCQDGNYHSTSTSRPPQRPDPAPRRCIPEPAARTSKAVSASNRDPHVEAHIPASRNNSGSSSGRERSLPAEYDFNEKSIDSSTRMQAQKGDKFDPHSFESVGDKKSHQALYRQHRPSDRGEQKREVMADSRERNSSQESNSTNISNKLTVPGMPGYSADGDHTKSARSRREMTMLHADSLSSDPSDCVRPRPPKPHKARKVKSNGSGGKNQNNSPSRRNSRQEASSSDEEIRSTTSCGDDLESESVISEQVAVPRNDNVCDVTRKETADKIKAIRNFLAHPVEWQVTSDHRHIIGHMILSKTLNADGQPHQDSGVILGLKVTGGRGVPGENRIAAFITAVKRGSIADTVGHLLSGDEVLEWNGRSLQGATSDEVCEVLLESKQEPEVELIIKRPFHPDALPPALQYLRDQATTRCADSPPRVTVTSADSPGMTRRLMSIAHVTGKIQLKLWYNAQEQDLTITVLGASELPLIEGNQPPQAFCKILLLPDSSEASLRTTKPVGRTREPEWQQNFNYGPISKAEFQGRSLDVSVWSKKKNNPDEFLGEISIELSTAKLNNEALWYRLRNHKNSNSRFPKYKQRSAGSQGTGSVGSKSRTSRQEMSDTGSEISDGNILEDESHYRSRHGSPDAFGRHGQHHQPPPRPRHHSANQLSREGPGIHSGPSPVPRRRQLPQVPQVPQMHQGSVGPHRSVPVSDRVPNHILDQHGPGGERPYYRGTMNGRYPIEQRDRSYSDSRVAASDDEMFMSDGSEMSEFSMRSTQSERPKSSNNFRRFMNRMESRGPAGRRQALPHLGIAASPLSYSPGDSGEPGTMSDSGMSNSHTDHRSNRQMGAYGRLHDHHERRYPKLNKQASKDSTDGSICSISSDSSNAKLVFAHLSQRIEGLKRNTERQFETANTENGFADSRRDSSNSNNSERVDSDTSFMSDIRYSSDISSVSDPRRANGVGYFDDIRRDSDPGLYTVRRGSFNSVVSSQYEDDFAIAQMSERQSMQNPDLYLLPQYCSDEPMERLNELAARKMADPRRLQVNEMVAAISNPDLFIQQQQAQKNKAASSAALLQNHNMHNSSFASMNSLHVPGQLQQTVPQFPYTNGGVNLSHLTGAQRLQALNPQAKNAQWAQPRNGNEGLNDFIEGLGPGQLVGRQVLGDSCLGEVVIGLCDKKGRLEIEIIRVKILVNKPGAKSLPFMYVKAYLMDGKCCVEKSKTPAARTRTLDTNFNYIILFMEPYMQRVLQVMVWGDYGKIDRKSFLGVAQINLDNLDLSKDVFGTYKLFTTLSVIGSAAKHSSQSSLDSAYSTAR